MPARAKQRPSPCEGRFFAIDGRDKREPDGVDAVGRLACSLRLGLC